MYLTREQAEDRLLSRYGFDASLLSGHAQAAGNRLDGFAPFSGLTLAEELPEAVLDWVALEAYKLSRGDEPGVIAKSVAGLGSKTYARPSRAQAERLQEGLLAPYGPFDPLATAYVGRMP